MFSHTGIFTVLFLCSFCCHGKVAVAVPDNDSQEVNKSETVKPGGNDDTTYGNSPSDLAQNGELEVKEEETAPKQDQVLGNENADVHKQEGHNEEAQGGLNVDGNDVAKEDLREDNQQEGKAGREDTDEKEENKSEPKKDTTVESFTHSEAASSDNVDDNEEALNTEEKTPQGRFKIKKSAKEVKEFQEQLEREENKKKRDNERKKKTKKKRRRRRDEYDDPDDLKKEPSTKKKSKRRDLNLDDDMHEDTEKKSRKGRRDDFDSMEDAPRGRKKRRVEEEPDYNERGYPRFSSHEFDGNDDDYDNEVEPEMFPQYKYSRQSNGLNDENGDHLEDMYSRPKRKRRYSDESMSPEEEDELSHENLDGNDYGDVDPDTDSHEQGKDEQKFKRGQGKAKYGFEEDKNDSGSKASKNGFNSGKEYDGHSDEEYRFQKRWNLRHHDDDLDLGKDSERSSRIGGASQKDKYNEDVESKWGVDQQEYKTPHEFDSSQNNNKYLGDTNDSVETSKETEDSAGRSGSTISEEYYEDAKEYIKQKQAQGKDAAEALK